MKWLGEQEKRLAWVYTIPAQSSQISLILLFDTTIVFLVTIGAETKKIHKRLTLHSATRPHGCLLHPTTLTHKLPPLCPSILSPAPTATRISVANMAKLPSVPDSQASGALRILASKINLVPSIPSDCLFQLAVRNGPGRSWGLHVLSLHLWFCHAVYKPSATKTVGSFASFAKQQFQDQQKSKRKKHQ